MEGQASPTEGSKLSSRVSRLKLKALDVPASLGAEGGAVTAITASSAGMAGQLPAAAAWPPPAGGCAPCQPGNSTGLPPAELNMPCSAQPGPGPSAQPSTASAGAIEATAVGELRFGRGMSKGSSAALPPGSQWGAAGGSSARGGSPPASPFRLAKQHSDPLAVSFAAGTAAALATGVGAALLANAAAIAASTPASPQGVVQRTWDWLAEQPEDAAELAALLFEAAPRLGVAAAGTTPRAGTLGRMSRRRSGGEGAPDSARQRLAAAQPSPVGTGEVDWHQLSAVVSSELLRAEALPEPAAFATPSDDGSGGGSALLLSPRGDLVEVNSGGQVLFCFFGAGPGPSVGAEPGSSRSQAPAEQLQQALAASLAKVAAATSTPHDTDGAQAPARVVPACSPPASPTKERVASSMPTMQHGALVSPATPPLPHQLLLAAAGVPPSPSQRRGSSTGGGSGGGGGYHAHRPERCLVVKFLTTRLQTQSEQFANELTRHLGICAPACRILRQAGASAPEWKDAHAAAMLLGRRGSDLAEQMARSACMLVMEYVPSQPLLSVDEPFREPLLRTTAANLGRLLLLDMVLGNPDRLPCEALGWRGNAANLLFATAGRLQGRLVAIDSCVQRRPPGGLSSAEDAACHQLTELALNDLQAAGKVLQEALAASPVAAAAVADERIVQLFQQELRAALGEALRAKGLLEMMYEVLSDWIDEFIEDIEELEGPEPASTPRSSARGSTPDISPAQALLLSPGRRPAAHAPPRRSTTSPSTTLKIRRIDREAQKDALLRERLRYWKGVMRDKGEELRAAVEEWQARRGGPAPRLTTGFLDGTHPIVDAYELKVRLEHMLRRLRALQDAAATGRPVALGPGLWLGGAVEAASHHLLRHLGVTHILNATEDLPLPDEGAGFSCLRCALHDSEEADLAAHLDESAAFIAGALAAGGGCLVHCHEGRSRSVGLALAYLMRAHRWTLRQALEHVQAVRPAASPNAGFMATLLALEERLTGTQSVKVKRTRPEPRVCPVCGEKVAVSAQSLAVHVRKAHPGQAAEALAELDAAA